MFRKSKRFTLNITHINAHVLASLLYCFNSSQSLAIAVVSIALRRLDSLQITHQISLKILNMIFFVINYFSKEKVRNIYL